MRRGLDTGILSEAAERHAAANVRDRDVARHRELGEVGVSGSGGLVVGGLVSSVDSSESLAASGDI